MNYEKLIHNAEVIISAYEVIISYNKQYMPKNDTSYYEERIEILKASISAMQELQKFQELGTYEELADAIGKQRETNGQFKIKIPNGYLMVEEKGTESEYPGVFISFSKDGMAFDTSNMIACVEYDSCTKEIKTETYQEGYEEPNNIISYTDGRNRI